MTISEIVDFKNKVNSVPDEEPDKHDGSYKLVRKAVDLYAQMLVKYGNLNMVGQPDFMVFFNLVVGTWVTGIPKKIAAVDNSSLDPDKQSVLDALLSDTWDEAEKGLYSNRENGKSSVGLFGAGMRTINADVEDTRKFILMLIKIKPMTDRKEIYNEVAKFIRNCTFGNIKATFSSILHCLKPEIFPVINNITSGFFAEMISRSKNYVDNLRNYIPVCNRIWDFCVNNGITFKSYRRIDKAIQI